MSIFTRTLFVKLRQDHHLQIRGHSLFFHSSPLLSKIHQLLFLFGRIWTGLTISKISGLVGNNISRSYLLFFTHDRGIMRLNGALGTKYIEAQADDDQTPGHVRRRRRPESY